ncbi:hypothetical protein Acy02nite_92400 [Actinoplanes cyaneus]|uniref:Uncharacterized protein n=2 Tax=Actinoplanes cyaneus TaxID=52696 RepID=A0A919MD59_9ACTN|nr:hypothetical protein Acy02nite_92400 [Actinoplanes cyaneus]
MRVIQLRVSYQLELVLDGDAEVTIEAKAVLRRGDPASSKAQAVNLDPEQQVVAPALAVFGATVTSSAVLRTGVLDLAFDNGLSLAVNPDAQFEAWQVRKSAGLLVCTPGGDIAIWS